MKKIGVLFLAAAMAFAAAPPAMAQQGGGLAGLLTSNPGGGDGLTAAIQTMLTNAPDARQAGADAAAIVALARKANPEQKAAIARGLLLALLDLDNVSRDKAGAVRLALGGLDPTTHAIFAALQAQMFAQNGQGQGYGRGDTPFYPGGGGGFAGGFAGGGSATGGVISPH